MGASNAATNAATQAAAKQTAQENAATSQINQIFSSPNLQQQYNQLGTATTQYYMNQLNQQQQINNRDLKFAMARNGLTGGSVAADLAAQAGKDYTQGVLEASQKGQQAAASLKAQDQTTQSNLLAMAQSGLNATTGAQNAASAIQSNLANAKANATSDDLGNMFGDFSSIYANSTNADAARKGMLYGYAGAYAPSTGSYASGGSTTSGSYL